LIRLDGLAPSDARPNVIGVLSADEIARSQTTLGLPVTGVITQAMIDVLEAHERKQDWTLATDGSGDAATFADIMRLSAGDIVIHIRPGEYAFDVDPRYIFEVPEESAYSDGPLFYRRVDLVGEGDRASVVVAVHGALDLNNAMHISNLTLRAERSPGETNPDRQNAGRFFLRGTATLNNVALIGERWSVVLEPDQWPRDQPLMPGEHANNHIAQNGGRIENVVMNGTIQAADGSAFDIVGVRIALAQPNGPWTCVTIGAGARTAIYDNDFSQCRQTQSGHAIEADVRAEPRIRQNRGASESPTLVRRDEMHGGDSMVY
jgi:hypothetical protein